MGSSPTRGSSFFLGKVTALGVLCCFALFVCLTLLASFFHLSFKNMYKYIVHHVCSLNPEGDEAAVQAVYESIQVRIHVHVHSCIACIYIQNVYQGL